LAWDLLALFWGEVETQRRGGGDFIIGRWDEAHSGDIWVGVFLGVVRVMGGLEIWVEEEEISGMVVLVLRSKDFA
jgi:hypothetical protein